MSDLFHIAWHRLIQQFQIGDEFAREGNPAKWSKAFWAFLQPLQETQDCLESLRDKRDLDSATGVWLDILGDIVGLARPFREMEYASIFACKVAPGDESDPGKGLYDAGPPATGGYLQNEYGLLDGSGEKMDGDGYRDLIRAKAASNSRDGSLADIYAFLAAGFGMMPEFEVPSPGNLNVTTDVALTQGRRHMIYENAPRLAGVNLLVVNWPAEE